MKEFKIRPSQKLHFMKTINDPYNIKIFRLKFSLKHNILVVVRKAFHYIFPEKVVNWRKQTIPTLKPGIGCEEKKSVYFHLYVVWQCLMSNIINISCVKASIMTRAIPSIMTWPTLPI